MAFVTKFVARRVVGKGKKKKNTKNRFMYLS